MPPSPSEERSRTELIVKTIALHLAVIAAAGHLISLQNQSRKHSKLILWELAWFLAVPTYPIAALIDRVFDCFSIIRWKGRQSVSLSYCIGGICGMHAEKGLEIGQDYAESVPLFEARLQDLRCVRQKRDWFWTGRVIILVGLMTQSVATLILSGRRLTAGQLGEVDIRNATMALGGLVVQLISACILLRGERWEVIPGTTDPSVSIQRPKSTHLGIVANLFITVSTMVSSWYFRFHIKDTYAQVLKKRDERLYTFPRSLQALALGSSLESLTKSSLEYPYRRPYSGTLLPNFYWLVWILLLYPAHQTSRLLALLTSAFLSLSFVIEEMVVGDISTWKDPLAEKLYVF